MGASEASPVTLNPTILLHEGELENQDKVSVRERVKAGTDNGRSGAGRRANKHVLEPALESIFYPSGSRPHHSFIL